MSEALQSNSELVDFRSPLAGNLEHNITYALLVRPMCCGDFYFSAGKTVLDWLTDVIYWTTYPSSPKKVNIKDKENINRWIDANKALKARIKSILGDMFGALSSKPVTVEQISDDQLRMAASKLAARHPPVEETHSKGLAIPDAAIEGELIES